MINTQQPSGKPGQAPTAMITVHQLVDQVLDDARSAHPGVEFGITLSLAKALLLPKEADKLWRPDADGRIGYYSGHVYRDCLVNEILNTEPAPIDYLMIVSPVYGTSVAAEDAVTYYGDLRARVLSTPACRLTCRPTRRPSPPDTSYRRLLVGGPVTRTYSDQVYSSATARALSTLDLDLHSL